MAQHPHAPVLPDAPEVVARRILSGLQADRFIANSLDPAYAERALQTILKELTPARATTHA